VPAYPLPSVTARSHPRSRLHSRARLDREHAGFTEIRATGWVSSPNATKEQLVELCQYVQDTSPVRDCLASPVPVTTTLEIR